MTKNIIPQKEKESIAPLSPSDVAGVVQFGCSETFTALKFRGRDDVERDEYPVSDGKVTEPDYAPAPAMVALGNIYEESITQESNKSSYEIPARAGNSESRHRDRVKGGNSR